MGYINMLYIFRGKNLKDIHAEPKHSADIGP